MTATPNRASDAGPESGPPPVWRDYLDFAADYIRLADRLDRKNDSAAERKLRIGAIDDAIAALIDALAVLP